MQLGFIGIPNVPNLVAERGEHIGDQASVTAPPEQLGAHDRCGRSASDHLELEQSGGELLACQVVGVCAERRMLPRVVRRFGVGSAASAKLLNPSIRDVLRRQRRCELARPELRKTTRAREPSHIHDRLDFLRLEHRDELVDRSGRVTDGPDCHVAFRLPGRC